MKKTIKLKESDLTNIVKRIINEQEMMDDYESELNLSPSKFKLDRKKDLDTILSNVHKALGVGHVQGIESKEDQSEHAKKMLSLLKKKIQDMKHLEVELRSSLFGIGLNA